MAQAEHTGRMYMRRSREDYARTAHTMVQPVRGVESAYFVLVRPAWLCTQNAEKVWMKHRACTE